MKFFIGPVEISGIGGALKEGFSSIGVEAETVFSFKHHFSYREDRGRVLVRLWQYLGSLRSRIPRRLLPLKVAAVAIHRLFGVFVLLWAIFHFDAFVFLYGQTITDTELELALLRRMGKKIIFLYVGSDTRPPYIDGTQFPASAPVDFERLFGVIRRSKKKVLLHEKYADVCVNSPASAHFHSKPFVNWFKIGIPKFLSERGALGRRGEEENIKILHSPSHPEVKGSELIFAAIGRLQAKGYPIDFVKIEGMPNHRVMEELARCDFVVDQIYSDTPMAAFATEAAHFGKPAVVAGYFSCVVGHYLSDLDIPPSIFVMPEQVESAIEKLITDRAFRNDLGKRAQAFVNDQWAPEEVAKRFVDLASGEIPQDWWLNPQDIRYVQGCGMAARQAKNVIKGLVERYGSKALQLADKPELENAFLVFASSAHDCCK